MKIAITISFFWLVSIALWGNNAYQVEDVSMVHLQDRTRYVCNPDGILSEQAVFAMDEILFALEEKTGIETLVVVVEQISGGDCFEFAYQLGKRNGVGKKEADNGLVVLLVRGERCVQFVTGYGLEGSLPDAICKRIQEQNMFPLLRQGKWDDGMLEGIRMVNVYLTDYDGWKSAESDAAEEELWEILTVFALFLIGFVIFVCVSFLNERNRQKCPYCKKKTALQRSNSRLISRLNGIKTSEVVYICKYCSQFIVRREQEDDESGYDSGFPGGPFVFGGGRGGTFHGGGFSGGSLGGGSFGGGGAGGRF